MRINFKLIGFLIAGAIIGCLMTTLIFTLWIQPQENLQGQDLTGKDKQPLYWVAPMDPSYKRDKPGKSPMGMELIPVYADSDTGNDTGPGTIRISPDVMNNLGVRTALAARKALHSEIKTVGYVKYDEDQLVHIHPRVEGWIEKLYVKAAGDPVIKGQPLYEIYSPSLVNAQEELVLALDRNNQRLSQAAEDRLKALQLSTTAIRQLKITKEVHQTVTFFTPQSGVVDNLNIREGFFVKPGTTMMSIGVLDQVWVEAEVFESQAHDVAVGVPVTMTLDYLPGKEWQGKVDYVYPALDIQTRTVKVRLRFDNKNEELKPNMFAQVVIHAKNTGDTLLVPREAVVRTGTVSRVVLALGDGRFKSINVKVGRFDADSFEILAGLQEGEAVVTSAQFLLDSESSKTSDFKRMHHQDDAVTTANDTSSSGVWTQATINQVMADHRMVNITHKAINEWGWPAMTMDFTVSESVDLARLKQGAILEVEIRELKNNQYEISDARISADQSANLNTRKLDAIEIDAGEQNTMKMDTMEMNSMKSNAADHKNMDHESMDHNNHNE